MPIGRKPDKPVFPLSSVTPSKQWPATPSIAPSQTPPLNPGTSCCNNADCRPTRAFVDGEGRWRAWTGSAWLIVPQERMLPADYAGDGRSHLCENDGFVYCFSPGEIRS